LKRATRFSISFLLNVLIARQSLIAFLLGCDATSASRQAITDSMWGAAYIATKEPPPRRFAHI
jgi:hypothetical protein